MYFYDLIILNWRIIALQCFFVSAIQEHESVISIYINLSPLSWSSLPLHLLIHLSRSSQSMSLASLLYSSFSLSNLYFIYSNCQCCFTYDSVYMSTSLRQFVPRSPSPDEST